MIQRERVEKLCDCAETTPSGRGNRLPSVTAASLVVEWHWASKTLGWLLYPWSCRSSLKRGHQTRLWTQPTSASLRPCFHSPDLGSAVAIIARGIMAGYARLRRLGTITSSQAATREKVERDGGTAARAISSERNRISWRGSVQRNKSQRTEKKESGKLDRTGDW